MMISIMTEGLLVDIEAKIDKLIESDNKQTSILARLEQKIEDFEQRNFADHDKIDEHLTKLNHKTEKNMIDIAVCKNKVRNIATKKVLTGGIAGVGGGALIIIGRLMNLW